MYENMIYFHWQVHKSHNHIHLIRISVRLVCKETIRVDHDERKCGSPVSLFKKYHGFVGCRRCFVDVEWVDE